MYMQNSPIEFMVSCGYSKGLEMVKNIVDSRDDVQICKTDIDRNWGCGEFYLKGNCSAYKYFLDMSREIEDPQYWFSVEQLEIA